MYAMHSIMRRLLTVFAATAVVGTSFALATSPAFAAGPNTTHPFTPPVVVGQVTAISGDTLTVASMPRPWHWHATATNTPAATSYSVNANTATVLKDGKTSTVSAIAVGDFVAVEGTANGTSVTATTIHDGMNRPHGHWDTDETVNGSSTPTLPVQGNGEPVIGGTISAMQGSSLTVMAKAGQTYTVDASNAAVVKSGTGNATLANVATGDAVVVQGAVNGNNVQASLVIDEGSAANTSNSTPPRFGFLGRIGGFFTHLFGFF